MAARSALPAGVRPRSDAYDSLADFLLDIAEQTAHQIGLSAGEAAAELVLLLAAFVQKNGHPDHPDVASDQMMKDFPVVLALARAHQGDLQKVRDDMIAKNASAAS